jgi:hypothetical protein
LAPPDLDRPGNTSADLGLPGNTSAAPDLDRPRKASASADLLFLRRASFS